MKKRRIIRRLRQSRSNFYNDLISNIEARLRVKIDPSSTNYINMIVNNAEKAGTISKREEKDKVITVLILSGSLKAKDQRKFFVEKDHISQAWETIKRGPGNCPPHLCVRRSVIDRFDQLKNEIPSLGSIADEFEEFI